VKKWESEGNVLFYVVHSAMNDDFTGLRMRQSVIIGSRL